MAASRHMSAAAQNAPAVAIAGGGLAGLAAGCALAQAGFRVSLFEKRAYLGGRASSYQHPGTGETVDNCQHVLLGCCTNLIDFYRRIGAEEKIRWYRRLTFVEPGGRRSVIQPGRLPAPFHSAGSFLAAPCLSLADKAAIARAMLSLARRLPPDTGEPFGDWLHHHGQTNRAIDRFWRVVLVSALNEELERVSSRYAAQVFRESFLNSAQAGALGLPVLALSELYAIAGDYIQQHGGEVRVRAALDSFRSDAQGVRVCAGGQEVLCDYAVIAVPFQSVSGMLPPDGAAAGLSATLARLETSPITGIHFWFDRTITDLPHAVLLDRTIQWMFQKSKFQLPVSRPQNSGPDAEHGKGDNQNSYIELVVSSSKRLVDKPKGEILDLALRELAEFFPGVRHAKVLKSTVIKEVNATYSPVPGADAHRPTQQSPWPRVFLAGDWTATGWPATMEGAVRSGYLAAEALTRAAGKPCRFMVADLPPQGLMRILNTG